MRIAIFETEHFEVAFTLIRLFDHPGNQLYIFCYEASYRQLKGMPHMNKPNLTWVVKEESDSKAAFIRKMYRILKKEKIRLFYLETVSDNFIFYAWLIRLLRGVRVLLAIHDINSYFFYSNNGTFRRWLRNRGRKALISSVGEFVVINSTIEKYLRDLLPANKKLKWIPGAFFDENSYASPPASLSPVRIVVPGSVDIRRRDYQLVFELLKQCNEKDIAVHVVLLGGVHPEYGREVIDQCKEYRNHHDNLCWYDSPVVDQLVFDREMVNAHFVLAPAVLSSFVVDDVEEFYGKSKSSGNIADIIRFARPAIMPDSLKTGPELTHIALRYSDVTEIPELLKRLRDDPSLYVQYCEQALQGSRGFTLERIRAMHPDLFKAGS